MSTPEDLKVQELAEEIADAIYDIHKPDPWERQELIDSYASRLRALLEERARGREEAMASMKPELYRLAAVETWARRIIGNAQIHAKEAKAELDRDEEEHGDHSLERTALRHAGGHLHRLVETLSQPLPDPAPEAEGGLND